MTFEVKTRHIEEQLVLTETRYGTTDGLSEFIGPAIGRGWERAPAYGGVVGPVLVIFHGEVSPEQAATVEVCIPVAFDQVIPAEEPHRVEPAHKEAYVRLPKRMGEYPQILEGYELVANWVKKHGKTEVAAPREVYFTDFMNAAPNDDALDIAFPIA